MNLAAAIEAVRPAIYQIRLWPVLPEDEDDFSFPVINDHVFGTAFAVSEQGYLVTADHVVEQGSGAPLAAGFAQPNVSLPSVTMSGNFMMQPVRVVERWAEEDLALLQLASRSLVQPPMVVADDVPITPPSGPVRLECEPPADGEAIAASGYPLNEPSLITTNGHIATAWAADGDSGSRRYLGDITINSGNSGGPMYRVETGGVVGVCVAGKLERVVGGPGSHAAGLTEAVPSTFVRTLLERNGVTFVAA